MVNKALVLKNCIGVMERKRKFVRQPQPGHVSLHLQLDLCSVLLSHCFR
jgi:hypothetical protein